MNRLSQWVLVLGGAWLLTGCANDNRLVGNRMVERREFHGEAGITGHLNQLTVVPPSRITKLSVVGDANVVTIMDTVTCGKLEVWGNNNQFFIPERLVVRISNVGENQFIRQARPGEEPQPQAPSNIFPGATEAEAAPEGSAEAPAAIP
jgi:hypothetical protein